MDKFMEEALRETRAGAAEGGIPIGAALVDADNQLISTGRNRIRHLRHRRRNRQHNLRHRDQTGSPTTPRSHEQPTNSHHTLSTTSAA